MARSIRIPIKVGRDGRQGCLGLSWEYLPVATHLALVFPAAIASAISSKEASFQNTSRTGQVHGCYLGSAVTCVAGRDGPCRLTVVSPYSRRNGGSAGPVHAVFLVMVFFASANTNRRVLVERPRVENGMTLSQSMAPRARRSWGIGGVRTASSFTATITSENTK